MIYNKDSKLLLDDINESSVHAVITDPPYGINLFSGQLDWDKTLPPKKILESCYSALKPGGFCLVFSHTRMFHRMACLLEDAGFKIKDCLCWGYASGMPKSFNIAKAINKQNEGIEEDDVQYCRFKINEEKWNGWGTSLKISWEPIILSQKPIEGRYIENIRKHHVGALNIDECRIPYSSEEDKKSLESFINFAGENHGDAKYFSANQGEKKQVNVHPEGRWPANLLWLDPLFADYDRMFMIPKPSSREKREYNTHPTVKPLHLMERLIKLVTPKPSVVGEDVVVLDPFCGSGTTGVACKILGRKFIGYESNEESFNTAQKRISEKVNYFDIFER